MILKHVKIAKKPIDFRDSGKNYYEAQCDNCEALFYPKRSDAMFCNSSCATEFRKKYINASPKPKKTARERLQEKMAKKNLQNKK